MFCLKLGHGLKASTGHLFPNLAGSLYASGKLPTYPTPEPIFCPKCEVSVVVGLGEG